MKKSALIVAVLALVVVAVLGAYLFTTRQQPAASPRELVPPSADVYIEIAPLESAEKSFGALARSVGAPISLEALIAQFGGEEAATLLDPKKSGFDPKRPSGLAMLMPVAGSPIGVAFFPITDEALAATLLGAKSGDLRAAAVSTSRGFAALKNGYLLLSPSAEAVNDLLALGDLGIHISPMPADGIASVYLLPHFLQTATEELAKVADEPMLPGAAPRSSVALVQRLLSLFRSLSLDLRWDGAGEQPGLRLRLAFDLADQSPIPAAFAAYGDRPPLLGQLPPGGLVTGIRMNPDGARTLGRIILDSLAPSLADSRAIELFQRNLDFVSEEAGSCLLPSQGAEVRNVTIQTMPAGREADFVQAERDLVRSSAALWETLMRDAGNAGSKMEIAELPARRYRGLEISGLTMTTNLSIEVPPQADAEIRRMIEAMRVQRNTRRAVGLALASGERIFVTASGEDPAIIEGVIDRLLETGAVPAPSPAISRIMAALPKSSFGYALIDPQRLSGGNDSASAHLIGVGLLTESNRLIAEAVIPAESIGGIVEALIPALPFAALGPGAGSPPPPMELLPLGSE